MASLDTDQPKKKAEEDRFKRYDFAKRIAGIIENNRVDQSLIIGIYGKWGEGKTSVMNFIKAELPPETVIVNFNPWLFSDQEQLIRSFLSSVAFELGESLASTKEKIGKALSDYSDAVGSITKIIGVPLGGFKQVGDKLQHVSIEKLKKRVDELICSADKKIVICVDDIDRLDVKEIQYIFKLVKLVGDFPNTSYLLAFDDEMIATALAPQYGDKHVKNGYQFLEKIIQLPLKIPKATRSALKKYTIDMLDQVFKDLKVSIRQKDVDKFREAFDEHFVPHIDNPRLAIRYSNAVYFALPMLYGEVSTADLMLVEGLKIFFPAAFDLTRHNSQLFLTDTMGGSGGLRNDKITKEQIVKETSAFLSGMPEKDRAAVKAIWQSLFPQFRYATGNRAYSDNKWRDWYKDKRICSGRYFDRYFTYAVQENEISDVQFDQFLSDLDTVSLGDAEERMNLFFEENEVSDIIFKLRLWEKDLSPRQSRTLSLLLTKKSEQLPIEPGEFAMYTTQAEGAKIAAQMIGNLPPGERLEHAELLFSSTSNFEFAMEIVYRLFYREGKETDHILTAEEQQAIKRFLAERFKSLNHTGNFFDILPDNEAWRVLSWWKEFDPEGLGHALELVLDNDSTNAIRLIKVFTPTVTSWGRKETRTYKSGFRKGSYDAMALAVDVTQVYDILANDGSLERVPYDLQQISDRDALSDIELASIFMLFAEQHEGTPADIDTIPE